MNFLYDEVKNWLGQPWFLSSKMKTIFVNVINGSAERGVKLSEDFLDAAKTEDRGQNRKSAQPQEEANSIKSRALPRLT